MFSRESQMQAWLYEELQSCDGLAELIVNDEYLDSCKAESLQESAVYKSYRACMNSLYINKVISSDENISLKKGDKLRPDFLMYAPEVEGFVVVELKNIAGPTREVGTELSAYAGEIRSHIPFLSNGDLYNVIISRHWPTLLRHYVFHEIFWQHKQIICLEPITTIDGLKLKIVEMCRIIESAEAVKLSNKNITGYQLCLYDYGRYDANADMTKFFKYLPQMESALTVMATEGEKQKSSGFAFLWRDLASYSLAPYSISIFNLSPFSSVERYVHDVDDLDELSKIQKCFINIVQEQGLLGHGQSLNNIAQIGITLLENICAPRIEGFLEWDQLRNIMLDRAEFVAFKGWGTFAQQFNDQLLDEYKNGNYEVSITSPELGWKVLEQIIDTSHCFIDLSNTDI